jgi:hypothetical protein
MVTFPSPRVRVVDRCAAAFVNAAARKQVRSCMGATVAEASAQFDPFQMKYGTDAVPGPLPTRPPPGPVTAPQIVCASGEVESDVHSVQLHPLTADAGRGRARARAREDRAMDDLRRREAVDRREAAQPLRPLWSRRPCCSLRSRRACLSLRSRRACFSLRSRRAWVALVALRPCGPVWLHEIAVSLGRQLSVAGLISRSWPFCDL